MSQTISTVWFTLLTVLLVQVEVYGQGVKGRPIEYGQPRGKTDETSLAPSQSRLGMLESELNRPFESFNPGRSLDGMMLIAPLPAPAPAVRNSRDLSNKRLDWMYRSAEDLMSVETVEDKYKRPELTPDGRDLNKLRPRDRAYYEALENRMAGAETNAFSPYAGPAMNSGLPGMFTPGVPGFGASPSVPNTAESVWQRAMRVGEENASGGSTDFRNFSRFSRGVELPKKPSESEIRRAQEFMQIHNFSGSPAPTTSPGSSHIYTSPYVNSSFFELPKPSLPAPSTPATTLPSYGGTALQSAIPALSTPAYTPPPASSPARNTASGSPFLDVTRRGF